MSSRALRRLEQQRKKGGEIDENHEGVDDEIFPLKNSISFSLLMSQSETEDALIEVKEYSDTEIEEIKVTVTKPNKKSKKGSKQIQSTISPPVDPDFDDLLEEFEQSSISDSSKRTTIEPSASELSNLLRVTDVANFDASAELRRKIGKIDPHAETSPEDVFIQKKLLPKGKRRVNAVVKPHPNWPTISAAGLEIKVEQINDQANANTFVFVPTAAYLEQFEAMSLLVDLGDIEALGLFIKKNPMMVDALLVFSDYIRMSSVAQAGELVEIALHILEKTFLTVQCRTVNLTSGSVRMPYEAIENRRMHLALFRHLQYLTRKGCYMAAWEVGKLLWSLDPDVDPLGVSLIIDFVALQAEQYDWLVSMKGALCEASTFSQLPWWIPGWQYSIALAAYLKGDPVEAKIQLKEAICTNPQIIPMLSEHLPALQYDKYKWSDFFESNFELMNPTNYAAAIVSAASKIHVMRNLPIWKQAATCSWLATVLPIILAELDQVTVDEHIRQNKTGQLLAASVLRHGLLSDLDRLNIPLPTDLASGSIHSYDPLPPDEVELYLDNGSDRRLKKCVIS